MQYYLYSYYAISTKLNKSVRLDSCHAVTLLPILQSMHIFLLSEISEKLSTRSTGITNLSQYLGGPGKLIPREMPTVRDVLRYLIYL